MIEDHGLLHTHVCASTHTHAHTAKQSKDLDCSGTNHIIYNLTVLHLLFEYIIESKY